MDRKEVKKLWDELNTCSRVIIDHGPNSGGARELAEAEISDLLNAIGWGLSMATPLPWSKTQSQEGVRNGV